MEEMQFCRACLSAQVLQFQSGKHDHLIKGFAEVTGILLPEPVIYMCPNCAAALKKCIHFRRKCIKIHDMLVTLPKEEISVLSKHKEANKQIFPTTNEIGISPESSDNEFKLEVGIKAETNANVFKSIDDHNKTNVKDEYNENSTSDIGEVNNEMQSDSEIDENKRSDDDISTSHDLNKCEIIKEPDKETKVVNDEMKDNTNEESILNSDKTMTKKKARLKVRKLIKKSNKNQAENSSDEDNIPLALSKKYKSRKDPVENPEESFIDNFTTVIILTPDEARKEVEARKETSNYKTCLFKCDYCYRGFDLENTFSNHMKKHNSETGSKECEFCHVRFTTLRRLKGHYQTSHTRKFCCKICPYTCYSPFQSKHHSLFHQGRLYECGQCSAMFTQRSTFLMHRRLKHGKRGYICERCGDSFDSPAGLRVHRSKTHSQAKEAKVKSGPKCEECNVQFISEFAWKRHLVLSSKHDVNNGCEICGETFPSEQDLKTHIKIHARKPKNSSDVMKEYPTSCDSCDTWLSNHKEYKHHMSVYHPGKVVLKKPSTSEDMVCVCEICGRRFTKICYLRYHQRLHTGEKPYSCEYCHKTFMFLSALYAHRKTHTSRDHPCEMCDKHFTSVSALRKHVKKSHLNIRPHQCNACPKNFLNKCDLECHVKYVHLKVPWPKRDRSKKRVRNIITDAMLSEPVCDKS